MPFLRSAQIQVKLLLLQRLTQQEQVVALLISDSRKKIAFGWYGGKYSHLDFLLPLIPQDATHFCDVFGGSAAVLLNVKPYMVETYNDIDSDLVNFFEVLRSQEPELIKAISLTPFSRKELMRACTPQMGLSKLESARRFFVRARQTRGHHEK